MAHKSILCLGENGGSHTHIFYTVDNICRYVHSKSGLCNYIFIAA